MDGRGKAANQLNEYKRLHTACTYMTTSAGAPVGTKTVSLTAGSTGPMLLQDFIYMDEMAHFNRERIPERVVHAKGAGAFGTFELTHDISKYCKASPFSKCGKKTPVAVRFSTVAGEAGSADTVRDPRGFAIKFYTEDGNFDLVGNNTPIFFIRDPVMFPSFIHSQKRNPVTHLRDYDAFWDFITLRHESVHQVLFLFSDRGIPDGYRFMNGYGSHAFKTISRDGCPFYVKFHFKSDQGIKNLSPQRACELASTDPDYAIKDLYNAIACKEYPSWTLYIQVIPQDEAEKAEDWNPFDVTKIWSHKCYPLIPVGKMVLNRNPKNYFAEVEQLAFSPAHMIPGIEPSPDKMLQGRLFAYSDTQRHRLGTNYQQIPVNCPYKTKVNNYQRDGALSMDINQDGAPNFFPNSFSGPMDNCKYIEACINLCEPASRYDNYDDDNYCQATTFYEKVLKEDERERLVCNIADHLKNAGVCLQERAIEMFCKVSKDLGGRLKKALFPQSNSNNNKREEEEEDDEPACDEGDDNEEAEEDEK